LAVARVLFEAGLWQCDQNGGTLGLAKPRLERANEYNAVQAAAAPIHPLQRDAFLKALAAELERHPVIGPGLVHRCAADLQRTFGVVAHSETLLAPEQEGAPGGALSPPAGRSQLLEPLALCNARLDRQRSGREVMATVFIEARPKGRREGTAIVDYVVEEQGDRFLKAFKTQAEAITWAKSEGHSPHVARVRHLNDKKIPDHWRPV
jgi:hypothetical protein